jgi:OmpA-OmpF porin, OOP family
MFLRNLSLFVVAVLISLQLSAQQSRHYKWELGLQAGVAQGQNDLNNLGQYEINPGGGLLLRYHIDDHFALRANGYYAEISGNDANYTELVGRGMSFSAPVYEGSLMFEADLFGKSRWKNNEFRRIASPYLFGGAGYAFSTPSINYNEAGNPNLRDRIIADQANTQDGYFVLPVGLGVKFDINENWVVGLETGLRLTFNDYTDGLSQAGNSLKNDTYGMAMFSVSYRLPYIADRDRDGVPDDRDICPDAKGSAQTNGCPDADGDGVTDNIDACPDAKGTNGTAGCPDADGDGIGDKSDVCPNEKGTTSTGGCPDTDRDGIADKSDDCPEQAGNSKFRGCPDSDNDGLMDKEDKCPNQAGPTANNGCPANDKDRDGVEDDKDRCPDQAGLSALSGCPDTDGDGVADGQDRCPNQAGAADNNGCPALTAADAKILEDAIYGVQFETGKSIIKATSNPILDKVADVMKRNAGYNLTIKGHTDSDGAAASNQKLSENRAKACYDYLVAKGIAAARMTHIGFGETNPVSDNTTPAGKAKNRRVEFELKAK